MKPNAFEMEDAVKKLQSSSDEMGDEAMVTVMNKHIIAALAYIKHLETKKGAN
ncbi:hypothetical protein [Geomicrobium sp. JCM 19039]|uniref:hypothetical protein n=1 Tax=Geomicrobium sp. JCM 19039 TaxID=1460636 RepID=UPI00045F1C78|nr:hypothetical protein [Geomicrobium sp. JCM 19039]GAK11364.1 hypothetical protein JCM19039_1054 [Geomicrobium sp. JCM 19039]